MKKVLKLSINKEIFENILSKKLSFIEKEATNYWKKELLEPKIINEKISYEVYEFEKIIFTNGLGEDKPQLILEIEKIDYDKTNEIFIFCLGKILEQKNLTNIIDEKDIIIKRLLDEKSELLKMIKEIKEGSFKIN